MKQPEEPVEKGNRRGDEPEETRANRRKIRLLTSAGTASPGGLTPTARYLNFTRSTWPLGEKRPGGAAELLTFVALSSGSWSATWLLA